MSTSDETLTLGGRDLVLLPMNFKTLKKILPIVNQLKSLDMIDSIDKICQVVFLALQTGNKDITEDFIEESLNIGNSMEVLNKIMDASGIVRKTVGEQVPVAS
jgi:hypothetical protein